MNKNDPLNRNLPKKTFILKPSSIPIINNDWFKYFSVIVEEGKWNDNINPFMSFINSATYNKDLYGQYILFSDFEQNVKKIINQFNGSSDYRKDKQEIKEVRNFVNQVVFHNPVCDFGFQVATIKKNDKNIFHTLKDAFSNQHEYCICPCSKIFTCWHKSSNIHNQF